MGSGCHRPPTPFTNLLSCGWEVVAMRYLKRIHRTVTSDVCFLAENVRFTPESRLGAEGPRSLSNARRLVRLANGDHPVDLVRLEAQGHGAHHVRQDDHVVELLNDALDA